MTVGFYVELANGKPIKVKLLQKTIEEMTPDNTLYLLRHSSINPSLAGYLMNDLHIGVSASMFDGIKGKAEPITDEELVLSEEDPIYLHRDDSSFFVTVCMSGSSTAEVRLKYGSSAADVSLAMDALRAIMRLAEVPKFTCEEKGDDEFTAEDIPTQFGDQWQQHLLSSLYGSHFAKRPKPGKVITLISPRRTYYLGHHSWEMVNEDAGGASATPIKFMQALHKAIRKLQQFDPDEGGYFVNMGIYLRTKRGTVSVGTWCPDVSYFMPPFTYIALHAQGGPIHILQHDLKMVAGAHATLLDELHLLLAPIPESDLPEVIARAKTVAVPDNDL